MSTDDKVRAYTQSRLTAEEHSAFESEMEKDPSLRAEVSTIQAVQMALSQASDDMPKNGWTRFSDKIDAQENIAANTNRKNWHPLLRAASIAIAAIVGWEIVGKSILSTPSAYYTTASADVAEASVQIVFSATATLSDVSEVLARLDGRIVDGPSALGIYAVSFPNIAARDAAFSALNKRADIASEVMKN